MDEGEKLIVARLLMAIERFREPYRFTVKLTAGEPAGTLPDALAAAEQRRLTKAAELDAAVEAARALVAIL